MAKIIKIIKILAKIIKIMQIWANLAVPMPTLVAIVSMSNIKTLCMVG